jgi:hypothetical protein
MAERSSGAGVSTTMKTCDVEHCEQPAIARIVYIDGLGLDVCQGHLELMTPEEREAYVDHVEEKEKRT